MRHTAAELKRAAPCVIDYPAVQRRGSRGRWVSTYVWLEILYLALVVIWIVERYWVARAGATRSLRQVRAALTRGHAPLYANVLFLVLVRGA